MVKYDAVRELAQVRLELEKVRAELRAAELKVATAEGELRGFKQALHEMDVVEMDPDATHN